jgi:SAM-dependent methyltransferase
MTREELRTEIARRAPWYQSIDFPEHGISTTDDPATAMLDAAWDNKTDELSLEEAARLRPKPKWRSIRGFLPPLAGREVLEIGSNCGFFSFEFARLGARSVTGLDVAPQWLGNAEWARGVLGLSNVRFLNCDFMRYGGEEGPAPGLLSHHDCRVPLPDKRFDIVFMSTVLDHLFFPLFAIYKMCRLAREWVIIDVPIAPGAEGANAFARLAVAPDNSHHGFTFTPAFLTDYVARLGIPPTDISVHRYNGGRNATYVLSVRRMATNLQGA